MAEGGREGGKEAGRQVGGEAISLSRTAHVYRYAGNKMRPPYLG